MRPPVGALAPFRIRSFRFQWPADMATSWAFEMETLILGWYVLTETGSVLMLTFFASLQYLGTLVSPMFGVMGDRIGHRNVLCAMRATYATLATALMTFAYLDALTPLHVFVIASMTGLVRPSDMGMRAAVVGDTMPSTQLLGAMSIQRTTSDSARIMGALTGAGLAATLGTAPAYAVVASLYAMSMLLTLQAGRARIKPKPEAAAVAAGKPVLPSAWRDLREGMAYVWNAPHLLACMCLAFLVNLTAFPILYGLLPYVAKAIYHTDQTGLGYMTASAAFGALVGSIVLTRVGAAIRPGRVMVIFCATWFAVLFVFSNIGHPAFGIPVLMLAGCAQSFSQVPMAALLLRTSDPQFRGRVMGIRMLAIYGNLPGLLASGPLISTIGYPATATLYCAIGIVFTTLIAMRWRRHLWRIDAPANTR